MLWIVALVAFLAGLAAALYRVPPLSTATPILGGVLVLAAITLGYSALYETWMEREGRLRQGGLAACLLLFGVSHLLPEGTLRGVVNAAAFAMLFPLLVVLVRARRRRRAS